MKEFDSMEQRIINMYKDLFPRFIPDKNSNINIEAQKNFYSFMQNITSILYENPSLLFTKVNTDDYFIKRFNKRSENKQTVYNQMRKIVKSLDEFFAFLIDFGKNGYFEDCKYIIEKDYKIPKKYINILEKCDISYSLDNNKHNFSHNNNSDHFSCWKWFATKPDVALPHFTSCMFDSYYPYTSEIYSKLSGNEEAFKKLEAFLVENNYQRVDNRDNRINLDYVKEYDKKDNELKEAWGERTHGGISAQYDGLMKNPPLYSLRVPYYKILLEQSDRMSEDLKEFIVKTGKKCDNCRYCVQMDKTGKKPFSYITVYNKNEYKMCTYFPGFQYCWEKLDFNIVDNIINFLIYIDKILTEQK